MVTYKYHRSAERIRSRLGSSAGGPIAHTSQRYPNRYNKGDGYAKSTRTIDHATGDWSRTRSGRSLPGYHPTPPRELSARGKAVQRVEEARLKRGMSEVAKKLGLFAGRLNPYVRAVDLAFDVYDLLGPSGEPSEWAEQGTSDYGDAAVSAGYNVCCDLGYGDGPKLLYSRYSYFTSLQSAPANVCGRHVGCGTSLQVPQGEVGTETFTIPERANTTGIPYVQVLS